MNKITIGKAFTLVVTLILVSIAFIPVVNSQFDAIFIKYPEKTDVINNNLQRLFDIFSKESMENRIIKSDIMIGTLFSEGQNWWDNSWPYRKLITIDHDKVDADLTNFPVLISLSSDSDLADHAQDDGDDIAFILFSDNTTQLNHEIEFFNYSTGETIVWVNVTSLSSSVDTKIWMYYGNNNCDSQENIEDTWDSYYVMVQHLNESSGPLFDSSSNYNDGINNGATFYSSAKIDGAYDFDGTDDHIDVGTFDAIGSGLTLSMWFNAESFIETIATSGLRLISKATGPESSDHFWMVGPTDDGNKIRYRLKTEDFVTSNLVVDTGGLNVSTWYYVVATYDGAYMKIFNDGVELGYKATTGSVAANDTVSVWIGSNPPNDYRPFNGVIDEIRVSNVARNSSWISTSYNNQNNSNEFIAVSEEDLCQYTLTINVDGNGIVEKDPDQEYYTYGTLVELTAVADPGWTFDHWSGDLSGSDNPIIINMTNNKTVTAHFTEKEYTLTINIEGSGSVIKDPDQNTYHPGTVVTLTADADLGWIFSHWSGDLSSSNNPENIIMTGNKIVTAHFELEDIPPEVNIVKPEKAIYVFNEKLIRFKFPIIFIGITIKVDAIDNESGVERVEFYIDGELKNTDNDAPFEWLWKDSLTRRHNIKVTAFDYAGNSNSQEISVWKWRFHPVLIVLFSLFALMYILIGG